MKSIKLFALLSSFLVAGLLFSGCSGKSSTSSVSPDDAELTENDLSKTLNLFNWSEYMPESVLEKFEKEYGVKVNYGTYSSNEEMVAKITVDPTNYDLAVASGYMVEVMRKNDLIAEIDYSNIPNIKNIGEEFRETPSDPGGTYSVPYLWGNVLIAVNTDKVKFPIKGYKDLLRPELKDQLVVLDDGRTMISIANKMQGKSMNETDPAVLKESQRILKEMLPNIKAFDSDSPKTLLLNGEVSAGIVYGAEAVLAREENPAIQAVLPEEGMNIWQDNLVIPKQSPHKKTAETFINFILRPEISAEIAKEYPYANPNIAALKLMDSETRNDPAIYPPESERAKGEYNTDIGEKAKEYDRIWSEFKME